MRFYIGYFCRWLPTMKTLPSGLSSGPLVLFDQHDNVLIISAFNHFTANSYHHDTARKNIAWGIMGNVNKVPSNYTMETILFYSSNGINKVRKLMWNSKTCQIIKKWKWMYIKMQISMIKLWCVEVNRY